MSATEPAMGRLDGRAHVLPVRVYYEDTDAGGIVYHANYLRFAERGRTDFLRLLGIHHRELATLPDGGVGLAVRHCAFDFLAPARLDDALEVVTELTDLGAATLDAIQTVRRDGRDLVRGTVRIACIGANGRPRRLPAEMRRRLAPLCQPMTTTHRDEARSA
jgi:acyl-CoA thioester hydrolase